jgi:hypothetical protein
MMYRVFFIQAFFGALVLACCASDGANVSQPASSTPTISLLIRPENIEAGEVATLTWSATNAKSCTASGAWSGAQEIQGSEQVTSAEPGRYTYTLICAGNGGKASASAGLYVIPCSRCKLRSKLAP